MKPSASALGSPARWTVRTRSAVASTLVVALCLLLAGGALLLVLFRSLEGSAQAMAASRAAQLVDQLQTESPAELDTAMLATDSQVGVVQVVDRSGALVAQSAGSPSEPLVNRTLTPGSTEAIGRVELGEDWDLWVTAAGVDTPSGPVTVLVGADREPVEEVITTVATLLAIGGPIVLALVAVGTYRLVGAALRPVERIRARVSSMTSGELAERIPVPAANDEVTRLAVTMNDMLDQLEANQAEQRRFVSDASHELRSPLASITASLDLAHQRPDLLDQSLVDDLLLPEAQRMYGLVEDLLLLARADELTGRHVRVDVDLDDIVLAEAERVRSLSYLKVVADVKPARASGDPGALARLLRNLVDNAIRHAEAGIRLECAVVGDHARVVVSDDGPGLPEADRQRVFGRFVRLDTPRDREAGGAGLGLSIVARIAEAHGGAVSVCDSDCGGASFVVELPLAADESVADSTDGFDAVAGER
ncbi:sensor histidine kinase [Mycolicibacterium moriokaense]|nr:sensor histidine kinase [Mycolicibacterium moriokaense]